MFDEANPYTHCQVISEHVTKTTRHSGGGLIVEEWKYDDYLHCDDGPARIVYNNNIISIASWCQHGQLHRENKPAVITFFSNSTDIAIEGWFYENKKHRLDGPAEIQYYRTGKIREVTWYVNDCLIVDAPDHWPLTLEEQIEFKLRVL